MARLVSTTSAYIRLFGRTRKEAANLPTPAAQRQEMQQTPRQNIRPGLIPGRVDIDHRLAIVSGKTRLGDWGIDTVIGAGHKGALVTAVDRASKYAVIEAAPNKVVRDRDGSLDLEARRLSE